MTELTRQEPNVLTAIQLSSSVEHAKQRRGLITQTGSRMMWYENRSDSNRHEQLKSDEVEG